MNLLEVIFNKADLRVQNYCDPSLIDPNMIVIHIGGVWFNIKIKGNHLLICRASQEFPSYSMDLAEPGADPVKWLRKGIKELREGLEILQQETLLAVKAGK